MQARVDDITIEFETEGTTGPAILLVHGLGGSRLVWREVAERLGEQARVIVPDLRGCGGTTRGTADYTLGRMADDLAGLAVALELPPLIAVGHSLGGVVVEELLVRHAKLLAGAVLVSTSSRLSEAATRNWKKLADIVASKGLSDSPDGQSRSFAEGFAASHPEVLAAHARIAASTDRFVYAEQARAASEYDYTDALAGVAVPTLILQGLADRLTPPGGSVILSRALAGSRLEMIEGAGHNLPMEMPERFARAVMEFADQVAGRAR